VKEEDNLVAQQKIVEFCREVAIISQNILKRWAEEKARIEQANAEAHGLSQELSDEAH
jgi:hypothetical protein